MPIVLKSGSLNIQEPSGPVQTCNGIDLLLTAMKIRCNGGAPRYAVTNVRWELLAAGTHVVLPKLGKVGDFDHTRENLDTGKLFLID